MQRTASDLFKRNEPFAAPALLGRAVPRITCELACVIALVLATAARAGAQQGPTDAPGLRLRPLATLDLNHLFAGKSFSSSVGSSTLAGFGGGLWIGKSRGLFLRATATIVRKTAHRFAGQLGSSDIPLMIVIDPLDIALGWTFPPASWTLGTRVFAGGGLAVAHYSEGSPGGNAREQFAEWVPGYSAFIGAEFFPNAAVSIAPELLFRSLPNGLGGGGVSAAFDETNLGSVTLRVSAGVRFGRR
jgi:hypothetical protein